MTHENRPRLFVSKCLGFEACRWNGAVISNKFVKSLSPFVDIITACPEKEIGLGVPRNPVRLICIDQKNQEEVMCQLETGKDVTEEMRSYSRTQLNTISGIDGFLLKDRSPSCGLKDVKVYPGLDKSNSLYRTSGLFAQAVLERFSALPVETEGRLNNFTIRENFLTRLFSQARFREISVKKKIKDLVRFHSEHKLLLMASSQKELRILGKITANHDKKKPEEVFSAYAKHLTAALQKPARYTSRINVLMHAFGYFSQEISSRERRFFLNTIEEYRREQIPLSVPARLVRSHAVRFGIQYLLEQVFFEPYPAALADITDSGKGRGG